MPDIRDLLDRAADGAVTTPDLRTIHRRVRRRAATRRAAGLAAVFALLTGGIAVAVPRAADPGVTLGSGGSDPAPLPGATPVGPPSPPPIPSPSEYPVPEGTPQPEPSPFTVASPAPVTEEDALVAALPRAPIGDRWRPGAVWADGELVVLGGDDDLAVPAHDGARYDPATGRWRHVPAPPTPMVEPALFSAGRQVLAVGQGPGDARVLTAVYDLDTERWRETASFPLGPRSFPAVAWTGEELVVWGGQLTDPNDMANGGQVFRDGAVYNLDDDAWRLMSDAPPQGFRALQEAIWTGAEVLFPGTAPGEPWAAYIPSADRWREFPAPPVGGSFTRVGAGTELIAIGTAYTDTDDSGVFDVRAARYEDGRWTDLGTTALPGRSTPLWTAWTGDRLLVSVGLGGYPLYALDPATGAWSALPNPSGDREGEALVWGDGRLWSWGGTGEGDGAVLEPLPR